MPFVLVIIGIVLLVAAYKNTQGNLVTALGADVPPFAKWFLALALVGGLGYVPGMATISRWLLALVLLVIVLTNYQQILAGFTSAGGGAGQAAAAVPSPASAYAANPSNPQITQASVTGTSAGSGSTIQTAAAAAAGDPLNPQTYLALFQSEMGFGGVA
jgi:hypothetical protein